MRIVYDPAKRASNLCKHGLDFEDAAEVLGGPALDIRDIRFDYGEPRIMSVGHLRGRMVVVVWTPDGDAYRIISMRKANDREQKRYRGRLDAP
ncbi:hypothetical protein OPKNFCMD_2137 [Methylobacterium crusticola]|uniref:BrnT family toxin n=1 Tax=Methylobacterium crusticola TaxID=1697972 RepID=A0ABQ4QVL8_9HYPH|nr:BrnT family toxin [Methylobacterium crusticola]GJD49407.1 hypothetical protein OPKNFCMD_2137 [Methylobacterium crusticola]